MRMNEIRFPTKRSIYVICHVRNLNHLKDWHVETVYLFSDVSDWSIINSLQLTDLTQSMDVNFN